ncbi:MAG: tetratricopeptide repeat protein [Proteobacteria bacterium]|nr:tetratricopeptide repeat protein [Pseudomonadota bacterium]
MDRPRSRSLGLVACSAAIVCLLAAAAPLRAEAPSASDMALAEQLFRLGRTYYDQGDYDKALDAFEQSYVLSQKPPLLHNIAKCQESLGRLEAAITSYERFLKTVGQRDATIEARIRNLKTRVAAQRASAAALATPPVAVPPAPVAQPKPSPAPVAAATPAPPASAAVGVAPSAPPLTAPPTPQARANRAVSAPTAAFAMAQAGPRRSRLHTWLGWSLIGGGGAVLVTSFVLGARAKAKADLTEKAYRCGADPASSQDCPSTPYSWTQIESTVDDQGRALERAQVATLLVGLLAAGSGAAILVFAPRGAPTERRVQLTPALGPGSVAISGSLAF